MYNIGFAYWVMIFKVSRLLPTAIRSEIPNIKAHYLKLSGILSPYPPRVFQMQIPQTIGLHSLPNIDATLDQELRRIIFPKDGELDFLQFRKELVEIVKAAREVNEGKTVALLKDFLVTVWEKPVLDFHPDLYHYGEIFDFNRFKEIFSKYNETYFQILNLGPKFRPYNPFRDPNVLDFLKKMEEERQQILARPFRYEKECKAIHQQIQNFYEEYRYFVGLLLGLFDILKKSALKIPQLYFLPSHQTSDGIFKFYSGSQSPSQKRF